MRISWGAHIDVAKMHSANGYGYATKNCIAALRRLGHEVNFQDADAEVHIHFDQPHHFEAPRPDIYKVAYMPWESTALLPPGKNTNGLDWAEIMNACDEVWSPSPLIADWYVRHMDINVPVFVYEHGVDPIWVPTRRKVGNRFRFLHVGAEASRKGGIDAMKALRYAFPNNSDVELNLKIISDGWKVGQIRRINVCNMAMPLKDMIRMFHHNHVYLYPSYGEGFGLTPLQAMATGMPTITVSEWAPYARFLDPKLAVSSKPIKSPWPRLHPGTMLKPNMDEVVDAMRYAYENYEAVEAQAHAHVDEIMAYYDWDRLTKNAFDGLAHRLQK